LMAAKLFSSQDCFNVQTQSYQWVRLLTKLNHINGLG